jgi:hypothetical protein
MVSFIISSELTRIIRKEMVLKCDRANEIEQTYIYYAGVWVFSLEILNLLAQIWNLFNSKRTTVVKPKKVCSCSIL